MEAQQPAAAAAAGSRKKKMYIDMPAAATWDASDLLPATKTAKARRDRIIHGIRILTASKGIKASSAKAYDMIEDSAVYLCEQLMRGCASICTVKKCTITHTMMEYACTLAMRNAGVASDCKTAGAAAVSKFDVAKKENKTKKTAARRQGISVVEYRKLDLKVSHKNNPMGQHVLAGRVGAILRKNMVSPCRHITMKAIVYATSVVETFIVQLLSSADELRKTEGDSTTRLQTKHVMQALRYDNMLTGIIPSSALVRISGMGVVPMPKKAKKGGRSRDSDSSSDSE